jgi:transmembrane sensor
VATNDDRIEEWLKSAKGDEPGFNVDAAWSRFEAANDLTDVRPLRRGRRPIIWSIAAAAIIAVVGLGVWRSSRMVEQVAANGERRTIQLGDGSSVTLNGGSRLRYNPRQRDVFLEGEAFFDVRHDATRPLRVHARQGVIEDVGTRFNVRAYSATIEVAVAEGSVTLAGDETSASPLALAAGQAAVLDSTGTPRRLEQSIDRFVGWTAGDLVLENVTLRDAALELERTYGGHVVVRDSALARRTVSARLHRETIQRALDAIVIALGAAYDQHDSTFVIHPRTQR